MSLLIAIITSAAVVLVSPFMGQLQSFLRRSLTTQSYVLVFGVGLMIAVALALGIAVTRIRDRRGARFGLLTIALALGAAYMWAVATPYAEVNAVERVHFVEYGLIAFLFYRAWRHAGDLSSVILPLLAGVMVGTFDEWVQWFIPVRVGEAHDVFLNVVSLVCGVLFAVALQPPATFIARLHPAGGRKVAIGAVSAWLVFATFVSEVHLGHEIDVEGIGRFRSHYRAERLEALSRDRSARWKVNPPTTLRRLSQEDQYLDEGVWHVRRRNVTEPSEAWRENLILERYFAPVLDTSTYAAPGGSRWPADQRADLATRAGAASAPFVSAAEPYPIVPWPRAVYWPVVIAIAVLLAVFSLAAARRDLRTDRLR
ncbi:MAG TPA: VanZ family protein [Vicinamibacterales bacterium]